MDGECNDVSTRNTWDCWSVTSSQEKHGTDSLLGLREGINTANALILASKCKRMYF